MQRPKPTATNGPLMLTVEVPLLSGPHKGNNDDSENESNDAKGNQVAHVMLQEHLDMDDQGNTAITRMHPIMYPPTAPY